MFLYCLLNIIFAIGYIIYSIFNRNNVSYYFKKGLVLLNEKRFLKIQLIFSIFISSVLLVGSILFITKILPSKNVYIFAPGVLFIIGHSIFIKIAKKKGYIDFI